MALGSLANTTKISGTKTMTTTKPVFQKISSSAIFNIDEWDTVLGASKEDKPKEYLEFNTPPLALVIAMQEAGKEGYEIYETLNGVGKMHGRIDVIPVITTEHQKRAADIYKHFRNKILMRRLKNMNISKFMLAVDDLIESPCRIDKESVRPLMKLPDFYEEDRATETIFNSHNTLPARNKQGLDTTIEYVGTVKRRNSRTKVDVQYWRTPNNYLVRLVFPLHDMGKSAWDFLAQQGKVKIKTEHGGVSKVTGYDYFVYTLGANYKIETV